VEGVQGYSNPQNQLASRAGPRNHIDLMGCELFDPDERVTPRHSGTSAHATQMLGNVSPLLN
jgi:hypothetical protein